MMLNLRAFSKWMCKHQANALIRLVLRSEASSLIEVAIICPICILLLVGAVDFGLGFYTAIEVSSAAQAGASYGIQQPADTAGIQAAAKLDASNVPGMTTAVATGCECSDGTWQVAGCASAPTSCGANIVNYVQVTTSATYTSLMKYPGIPTTFSLQGSARIRAVH